MQHAPVNFARGLGALALMTALAGSLGAQALPNPLPLKYVGPPTVAAITPGDLMTRLYKYADDSMMGRMVGTEYNVKATAYIEREVRRLGLVPAGDNGGYFESFGTISHVTDPASTITVGDRVLHIATDFIAFPRQGVPQYATAQVIYGGVQRDTLNLLDSAAVAGKVVLLSPPAAPLTSAMLTVLNQSPASPRSRFPPLLTLRR